VDPGLADHGQVGDLMPPDGGDADATLATFADAWIDHRAVAEQLQRDGAAAFERSWTSLLTSIAAKHQQLTTSGH